MFLKIKCKKYKRYRSLKKFKIKIKIENIMEKTMLFKIQQKD